MKEFKYVDITDPNSMIANINNITDDPTKLYDAIKGMNFTNLVYVKNENNRFVGIHVKDDIVYYTGPVDDSDMQNIKYVINESNGNYKDLLEEVEKTETLTEEFLKQPLFMIANKFYKAKVK